MIDVLIIWIPPNCDPRPRINIMMKNKIAHNCGRGIKSTASGYVIKVNPGPDATTVSIGTFMLFDKNPKIAKTTNPANTAVPKFVKDTKIASK